MLKGKHFSKTRDKKILSEYVDISVTVLRLWEGVKCFQKSFSFNKGLQLTYQTQTVLAFILVLSLSPPLPLPPSFPPSLPSSTHSLIHPPNLATYLSMEYGRISFSYVLGFGWFGEPNQLSWIKTDFWKKKKKCPDSLKRIFSSRGYTVLQTLGMGTKESGPNIWIPCELFAKLLFFLAQVETDSFF